MSQTPIQQQKHAFYSYPRSSVQLTENQRRVIIDKYLKESPSVESWLWGVAENVALAELLHHPLHENWGLFDGVRLTKREFKAQIDDFNPTRTWLFHNGI